MFKRKKQPLSESQINFWNTNGYLVLPKVFSVREMQHARKFLEDAWERRAESDRGLTIDAMLNGQGGRKRFRDASDIDKQNVYKLNDAFIVYPEVRDLALDDYLESVLSYLVSGKVCVCNSLHFERGSQQGLHVDTFYMPPPASGQLIAVSICLEDVHPDAGPLNYVPQSHTIPPFLNDDGGRNVRSAEEQEQANWYYQAAIRDRGLHEDFFLGRAGDVIIWHEQLVHGGSPIRDLRRTRKSLVVHYWRCAEMDQSVLKPHRNGFYFDREPAPLPS
jgi:phytanoyl-CoA hydroxylase